MAKIVKFVSQDAEDVKILFDKLMAGKQYHCTDIHCPVCGIAKYPSHVTCQRKYCMNVWRIAKKKYDKIPPPPPIKQDVECQQAVPSQEKEFPLAPRTVEAWYAANETIKCKKLSARVSPKSCGKNWRCFDGEPCFNIPWGAKVPPKYTDLDNVISADGGTE